MALIAGSPIGKYLVHRKLAEGGMAEIYLCSARGPEGFEKEVVIKRIRSSLSSDPQFVRMFIGEARLASRLNHPNLVQIFDFDKHGDAYYLAMEYVRGHSLAEVRRRCQARMAGLPPTLAAHIGAEIARGLHHVHRVTEHGSAHGLVHRDVTPHNVLLSFDGAVKLTDFGIAKASDKLPSRGRLEGKLAYMSPEQSRGERVDARTDVFSLGIVLWEMMTGGRLFEGDGDRAVLQAVRTRAIPSVARLNPDVPLDLDAVVMKALERNPESRYQTARELERALAQCVLRHARAFEDTDVGGFLRRLFLDERSSAGAAAESVVRGPDAGTHQRPARAAIQPLVLASARRWKIPGRTALKLALGAVALSAMVASPKLRTRPPDEPPADSGAAESPVQTAPAEPPQPLATPAPTRDLPATVAPTGDGEPASAPLQTRHGTLVLKIAPWAFLSIDQRNRGEVSGIKQYRLAAGKHRLRLWHPRGSKEVEILLGEGQRLVEEYQVYPRGR